MQVYAPYATAPTSILVYKGRAVLVRRCADVEVSNFRYSARGEQRVLVDCLLTFLLRCSRSAQSAVQVALVEFRLDAKPASLYISAKIGAQGQEVEVGKVRHKVSTSLGATEITDILHIASIQSAFPFIKDIVPFHVRHRDERREIMSEEATWPPFLPTVNPYNAPSSPVHAHRLQTRAIAEAGRTKASTTTQSGNDTSSASGNDTSSQSDWRRSRPGTPIPLPPFTREQFREQTPNP